MRKVRRPDISTPIVTLTIYAVVVLELVVVVRLNVRVVVVVVTLELVAASGAAIPRQITWCFSLFPVAHFSLLQSRILK